jgi:hypothetical protein
MLRKRKGNNESTAATQHPVSFSERCSGVRQMLEHMCEED